MGDLRGLLFSQIEMTLARMLFVICLLALAAIASAEPIHIEVAMQEGGEGLDIFHQIIASFQASHPGIKVDLEADPRVSDLLRVRILEKNFPEITNADFAIWNLARAGDIYDLKPDLQKGGWGDSFLPGTLDRFSEGGKVFEVPLSYYVQSIYYNRDLFDRHGWATPRTWPEFLKLCETIKASGVAPMAFQGRYPYYAGLFIDGAYYQLAGSTAFVDQKNLVPGCYNNPAMVQALAWTQTLATKYFQTGAMGMGHTEAQLQFFLGHAAMIPCGSWLKSEMTGKIPDGFRLGTFNVPTVDHPRGDPTALNAAGGYYTVFSRSKHPAEAVQFLRYLTSPAVAATFCRARDLPVAIKGVNEKNLSPELSQLAALIKDSKASFGAVPGEGFPEMSQYIDDTMLDLMSGRITPQAAAEQLERSAVAVRHRAEHPDDLPVTHLLKPVLLLTALAAGLLYSAFGMIRRKSQMPLNSRAAPPRRMGIGNALVFVGPSALLFLAFVLLPGLKSFAWSTLKWDGLTNSTFVGVRHFKYLLLQSDEFWIALANNLFIMFVIPAFVVPLSLLLAACVSRGVRGSKIFRGSFLLPSVIGGVGSTLLWQNLYDPNAGVINAGLVGVGHALKAVGLAKFGGLFIAFDGFAWLSQDHLYTALVPMSVWAGFGFNFVLYLAAMEAVPTELYEAAELDGATPWQQFFVVTLPLIWEVLTISTVFMIVGGMKAFESIWLLTNQAPSTAVHVVGTLMMRTMFSDMRVGQATAVAVLMFAIVFVGSVVAMRGMRRETVQL